MYNHDQIQLFSAVLLFYLMRLLAKPIAARLKAFEECLSIVPFNVQCVQYLTSHYVEKSVQPDLVL